MAEIRQMVIQHMILNHSKRNPGRALRLYTVAGNIDGDRMQPWIEWISKSQLSEESERAEFLTTAGRMNWHVRCRLAIYEDDFGPEDDEAEGEK
jgi:hypothetical protein